MTAQHLIQSTSYLFFCEQTCSFQSLQIRFSINDKITNQIINILEGLYIISFDPKIKQYKVLISNLSELEDKLDLLFKLHQMKYPNRIHITKFS